MRKAFFLLFLLSSVISFAQSSLYSDLHPNGQWYTDESRDAAYESSVSKLHKTWIACNNTPMESITFKPNNVGNIGISLEQHDDEEDYDYIVVSVMRYQYIDEQLFSMGIEKDKVISIILLGKNNEK